MKDIIFKFFAGPVSKIVGSRNLARTGAFIARAGRMDFSNAINSNGETLVQEALLAQLQENVISVIDCGANQGQWSTQFIKSVQQRSTESKVHLYCFEPSSFTFDILCKNLNNLNDTSVQFTPVQKALSNCSGEMTLKVAHDGAGTNSLTSVPGTFAKEETVSVTTVDEFSSESGIRKLQLLKIDAEGHDFEVILGAQKMLSEGTIEAVQFEYNWRWIYGKHCLQEVFELFDKYHYSVGKITPYGIQFYPEYHVNLETFVEGNYIACKRSIKSHFSQVKSWI